MPPKAKNEASQLERMATISAIEVLRTIDDSDTNVNDLVDYFEWRCGTREEALIRLNQASRVIATLHQTLLNPKG
jgi:hypothetical protein